MQQPTYPDPDPIMRFISQEEAPASFWQMPPQLRSHRARLYIVARCAGTDPMLSWMWAMSMSDEGKQWADEIVSQWPDERIEQAVAIEFGGAIR